MASPNLNWTRDLDWIRRSVILSAPMLCSLPSSKYPCLTRPPLQCSSVGWSLYLCGVDTFFPQYVSFFKGLDIVNLISIFFVVLYCIIWTTVIYRSPKFRVGSGYVMGTAVALVIWHIPGLITLIAKPQAVLCENPISRATAKSNQLCAAQGNRHSQRIFLTLGFLFVFSTHAVVTRIFG